jgi:hypothetical protein
MLPRTENPRYRKQQHVFDEGANETTTMAWRRLFRPGLYRSKVPNPGRYFCLKKNGTSQVGAN